MLTPQIESQLRLIAEAYDRMERTADSTTIHCYRQFVDECYNQFLDIPVVVEFVPHDPYASAADMFQQVRLDNRLLIYTGDSVHPVLTERENHIFRAIHDWYGHIVPGNSFDPSGEFTAWQCHLCMFRTTGGRAALTTETLGQLAWRVYGPNEHLPYADRPYAEQKAGLIDPALWSHLTEVSS